MEKSKNNQKIDNNGMTIDDQEIGKIIVKDANNFSREGEILFSFSENGDDYIIYELDNQAFGAKIDDNNHLKPIDDDEWPLVEKIYKQYCDENDGES